MTYALILKGAIKSTLALVLPFCLQILSYLQVEIQFKFPSTREAENFPMANQPPETIDRVVLHF